MCKEGVFNMKTTTNQMVREFNEDAFAEYLMSCIECEYEPNVDAFNAQELAFYNRFMGYEINEQDDAISTHPEEDDNMKTNNNKTFNKEAFAQYLMDCIECECDVDVDALTQEEFAFYLEFMGYEDDEDESESSDEIETTTAVIKAAIATEIALTMQVLDELISSGMESFSITRDVEKKLFELKAQYTSI
jgi:hypothetical protein